MMLLWYRVVTSHIVAALEYAAPSLSIVDYEATGRVGSVPTGLDQLQINFRFTTFSYSLEYIRWKPFGVGSCRRCGTVVALVQRSAPVRRWSRFWVTYRHLRITAFFFNA